MLSLKGVKLEWVVAVKFAKRGFARFLQLPRWKVKEKGLSCTSGLKGF